MEYISNGKDLLIFIFLYCLKFYGESMLLFQLENTHIYIYTYTYICIYIYIYIYIYEKFCYHLKKLFLMED